MLKREIDTAVLPVIAWQGVLKRWIDTAVLPVIAWQGVLKREIDTAVLPLIAWQARLTSERFRIRATTNVLVLHRYYEDRHPQIWISLQISNHYDLRTNQTYNDAQKLWIDTKSERQFSRRNLKLSPYCLPGDRGVAVKANTQRQHFRRIYCNLPKLLFSCRSRTCALVLYNFILTRLFGRSHTPGFALGKGL